MILVSENEERRRESQLRVARDPETRRDFGLTEVPLLRNLTDSDETISSNFSSSHSGNDGIGSVSLDVGEELVVGFW